MQQTQVLKLRKRGLSLNAIIDETSLGMRTVRAIIDKQEAPGFLHLPNAIWSSSNTCRAGSRATRR
jgi:hypothetical protein